MDHASLKTASTYINNLLLARGLLRDGTPIEFARPHKGSSAGGSAGTDATMARVINLVHDLILRRDRDQTHHESLATSIRSLRTDLTHATTTTTRLETSLADTQRQLSLSQAQERSARGALRAAEAAGRAAREESARTKATAAQVRASCANDVRKRDVQIQRLKGHLMAQQRGNRGGVVGASITITPGAGIVGGPGAGVGAGTGGSGGVSIGMGMGMGRGVMEEDPAALGLGLDDPNYSLKQETTEFLTQLSQQLSDENDNLIGLVRSSIATLRELQGLPEELTRRADAADVDAHLSAADSAGRAGSEDDSDTAMTHSLPSSYESLATDMDGLLDNLRNLLTNPNFVSIDEVESREEEIGRLRAGWEKMETRWREAIGMMEGWRKRVGTGDNTVSIKLDELKQGLGLGLGLSTIGAKSAPFSLVGVPEVEGSDDEMDSDSAVSEQEEDIEDVRLPSSELDEEPPAEDPIFDIKLLPRQKALQEGSGNTVSPRKVSFAPDPVRSVGKTDENASEVDLVPIKPVEGKDCTAADAIEKSLDRRKSRIPEPRVRRLKRNSSPTPHPEEPSPKMTVQDKLDVAQAEAEAAAIAAKLRVAEAGDEAANSAADQAKAPKTRSSPNKRTRITGRARRRKSTLSPEELDALLGLS